MNWPWSKKSGAPEDDVMVIGKSETLWCGCERSSMTLESMIPSAMWTHQRELVKLDDGTLADRYICKATHKVRYVRYEVVP